MPLDKAFQELGKFKNDIDKVHIDEKIENFNKIDNDIKKILNLFAQLPFLDDMVANLFIKKYFEKNENIVDYLKSLLYLTNVDSEFWTVKEWIKEQIEYKKFDYDLLNLLIEEFISEQKDISKLKALKYLLIQSRLLLHIEDKAKIVTEEFSKAIKDSKEDMKVMEIVDSQLEEFISLSKDNKSEAMRDAYFLRAMFLRRIRKFNKAKECFEKTIKFPQEDEITAEAYQLLGFILFKEFNKFKEAEVYLNKSIKILDDNFLKAKSYSILGNFYKDKRYKNFYKAKEYFEKSLEIEMKINNKRGEAKVLHDLGTIYLHHPKRKEYLAKAKKYLEHSLKLKKQKDIEDKKGEAQVLHDLGILYTKKDNFEKAKEYFEQSLKIEKEQRNRRGEAKVLSAIGFLYENIQYNIVKAEKYYKDSLKIEIEEKNKKGQKIVEERLKKLGL